MFTSFPRPAAATRSEPRTPNKRPRASSSSAGSIFGSTRKETTNETTHNPHRPKESAPQPLPRQAVAALVVEAMNTKQLLDLVEASIGKRPLMLSVTEFALITGRDRTEISLRVGRDIAAQRDGDRGFWRIPVQELKPYLEGTRAA